MALNDIRTIYKRVGENKRTLRWCGCIDKTAEKLYMPCRAMQSNRLQVLFHTLIVLDLSWDRNGHCVVAVKADKFCRIAASVKEEVLATEERTVWSVFEHITNQWRSAI